MFGSLAVEQWIYGTVMEVTEVTDLVGDEVHVPYAPLGTGTPYMVAYRTDALDSEPAGAGVAVAMQRLTYSVAIVGEGNDKFALLPAARALHDALQGKEVIVKVTDADGVEYGDFFLTCVRVGELPNDDIAAPDDGEEHVALGGVYEFEVTESGA